MRKFLTISNYSNGASPKYCRHIYTCTGSGDGAEERWNGGDRLGREHPLLVDGIQRCRVESGARRPGLAAAAESSVLPTRIHVHDLLRQHRLRALDHRRRPLADDQRQPFPVPRNYISQPYWWMATAIRQYFADKITIHHTLVYFSVRSILSLR